MGDDDMPQPLPVGKTTLAGPNIIMQRPELAAHIANVGSSWALVESDLVLLYALLMGTYLPSPPMEEGWYYGASTHPVAYQIFDAMYSLDQRLKLLERLAQWRALPEEAKQLEMRGKLVATIRKRFGQRSIVAHGLWSICDDYPDALILRPTYGRAEIWKVRDFEATNNQILELHNELGRFTQAMYERFRQRT